jgi:hypothetical protein
MTFREWQRQQLEIEFHFDLDAISLGAYVEVKGVSGQDSFKVFRSQLEFQKGELGFPVDEGILILFSYRNLEPRRKGGKHRRRLFSRMVGNSLKKTSAFLANNTLSAYVVDFGLLGALASRRGYRTYSRDRSAPRDVVHFNRQDLKQGASDARQFLGELGYPDSEIARWLPPRAKQLRPRTIETEFAGQRVSFELNLLLPNGLKKRLLHRLNGAVKRIEPGSECRRRSLAALAEAAA